MNMKFFKKLVGRAVIRVAPNLLHNYMKKMDDLYAVNHCEFDDVVDRLKFYKDLGYNFNYRHPEDGNIFSFWVKKIKTIHNFQLKHQITQTLLRCFDFGMSPLELNSDNDNILQKIFSDWQYDNSLLDMVLTYAKSSNSRFNLLFSHQNKLNETPVMTLLRSRNVLAIAQLNNALSPDNKKHIKGCKTDNYTHTLIQIFTNTGPYRTVKDLTIVMNFLNSLPQVRWDMSTKKYEKNFLCELSPFIGRHLSYAEATHELFDRSKFIEELSHILSSTKNINLKYKADNTPLELLLLEVADLKDSYMDIVEIYITHGAEMPSEKVIAELESKGRRDIIDNVRVMHEAHLLSSDISVIKNKVERNLKKTTTKI